MNGGELGRVAMGYDGNRRKVKKAEGRYGLENGK